MVALAAEARAAGDGLIELARGRAEWDARFHFTVDGFMRSFTAPLLALPLAVAQIAVYARATGDAASIALLISAGLAHLADAFGFPLLLALIAGPLRIKGGYLAFVTVNNWATLYLNIALAAAASLLLCGRAGVGAFGLAALALLCLSVALVWRIARETLTRELAPLVLLVVLSVAWSTFCERACNALLGA